MKKLIALISLVCLLLIGCNGPKLDSKATVAEGQKKLTRVVAVGPAFEELALALLEPEQLAGISNASRQSPYAEVRQQAAKIKTVIDSKPSTESIVKLKPELVLIPIVFGRMQADTLQDAGLKVLAMDVPQGYKGIKDRVTVVAKALGCEAKGTQLLADMDKRLQRVQAAVAKVEKPRLVVGYSSGGAFGRKGGSFDNLCKEAGAVNGAGLLNLKRGEHLSKEQIIALNPDVILYSKNHAKQTNESIMSDPALKNVKAIKNGRVVLVEDYFLFSSSQYFVNGVERIAKLVYPECF